MRRIASPSLALCMIFAAGAAFADSLDYGAYERLFGEPVTRGATGKPERLSETPVNMQIISAEDIRRSGSDNIPDILRFVAGVDVRRYGLTDADVGIRGYDIGNSPRVLVLINGRQFYIDYNTYTSWQTLPVQLGEIRQIEIIKGPNSALYGFNAVGGVINIITYDPLDDDVGQVTFRTGTQEYTGGSVIGTAKLGERAGLRLSAGGLRGHEASTADQPKVFGLFNRDNYNHAINADGRWKSPSGVNLTAEISWVNAQQWEMGTGGFPGTSFYSTNSQKLGLEAPTSIGTVSLTGYRNQIGYRWDQGGNDYDYTKMDNRLYVLQASDLFKLGSDHSVRLGLEFRSDDNQGSYYKGETMGFDLYSGSAMWNWQIDSAWSLTNSVRVDHMTTSYTGPIPPNVPYPASAYAIRVTEPSFNSALVWRPTGLDSVRLSAARAVQPPNIYQMFPQPPTRSATFTAGTGSFEGDPHLKPSIVMNYEADYSRTIPEWSSTAQLAVFWQQTRDVLAAPGDAGPPDANGIVWSGNIGRSRAVGGELTLKGSNADGWRWNLGYALALIKDDVTTNQGVITSSIENQRGTPVSTVIAGFGRSWDQFEADVSARWQTRFDDVAISGTGTSYASAPIQSYAFFLGHLGYKVTEDFNLGLTGALATLRRTSLGLPTENRLFLTATHGF